MKQTLKALATVVTTIRAAGSHAIPTKFQTEDDRKLSVGPALSLLDARKGLRPLLSNFPGAILLKSR
jgi:hypothetical protein